MPIQHHKTRIRIDDRYDAIQRSSIASELISVIRIRTDKGQGVSGNPGSQGTFEGTKSFPGYSKDYIESKEFKLAGKSSAKVNLKLSSSMMNSLKLLNHGPGFIDIGYESGSKENAKAEGNIIGSYGRNANASKARNFLGITGSELQAVLVNFPLPRDNRLQALAALGVIGLLTEDSEDKEFFLDLDINNLRES